MSKSFKALGLALGALALTHLPASAQTKVTNEGISATEIVIGTHQDLSGPIKVWGVPVSNGMKMAVEEVNAAGTAEVQQPSALCREYPRRGQIHDRGKEFQETMPDASGR